VILAIDPGNKQSGFCWYLNGRVIESGISDNEALLKSLIRERSANEPEFTLAIEMIASYGMAVGKEVFETCVWIGRFMQAATVPTRLVYRKDVKLHLCNSMRAKDANIRTALIDKLGAPGTKKMQGPTYGVKSHAWAALAVAVTAAETKETTERKLYGM
jgi:hypothetical protein